MRARRCPRVPDHRMVDVGEVLPAILRLDEVREAALLEDGIVGAEVDAAVGSDPERVAVVAHDAGVAGPEVGPVGGVAGGTGHRRVQHPAASSDASVAASATPTAGGNRRRGVGGVLDWLVLVDMTRLRSSFGVPGIATPSPF